jgi:cytochrome c553
LGLLATAAVYLFSEHEIRRQYAVPFAAIAVPHDVGSIEKGKRLATVYGCFNSCHGKQMEGSELYDEPGIAKINAPNLTRVVREYTDAQLERLIRHGVKRDGTTTWIMPSPMFSRLSDEDLGQIIAFVRSSPVLDGPMREVTVRPLGRLGIVTGQFKPLAGEIAPAVTRVAVTDRSDPLVLGKYLVQTACTECHGADLKGSELVHAPGLAVSAAYSDEDFKRLLRTGIAIGGREVGMMTEVGRTRFPSLTDEEVNAVREYLKNYYASSQGEG